MKTLKNFIGNKFVEVSSGEYFTKDDPTSGKPLLKVPISNEQDAQRATAAAEQGFLKWSKYSMDARCEVLFRIADAIEKKKEEFARLECEDTGKPISLCRELDIPRAIHNFRFFAEFAKNSTTEFFDSAFGSSYSIRKPLGVVALVTPWNLPIYLLTWKLAPALAMGNSVVAKPSELTPQTSNLLAEIFAELDLPSGLVNIIHGPGKSAAEPILTSPSVRAISFTGGTQTGRRVAELAARDLKKLSLELGGKNPTLIFDDANLNLAAKGVARSSFLNQGQICLCGERIFIQENIYQKFVQLFVEEAKLLQPGLPSLPSTNYGALISRAHLDKVKSYVELAKTDGGKILLGGHSPEGMEGFYFLPTIIDNLAPTCRTSKEEIFGPVVTLHPFKTEEEAVQLANDIEYGLSASCWTNDLNRARRLGDRIDVGTVWINTWLMRDLRVPFGGMKKSGLGREGGEHSMNFFSEFKTVCIKKDDL